MINTFFVTSVHHLRVSALHLHHLCVIISAQSNNQHILLRDAILIYIVGIQSTHAQGMQQTVSTNVKSTSAGEASGGMQEMTNMTCRNLRCQVAKIQLNQIKPLFSKEEHYRTMKEV